MSADVIDLSARRHAKAATTETVLKFSNPREAFTYALERVAGMQQLTADSLLVTAEDLYHPLAEVAAVLVACRDLARPHDERTTR